MSADELMPDAGKGVDEGADRGVVRGVDDGGMVTVTAAILCVGMLFMSLFVVDGGRMLVRYVETHDVASAAARAAAQAVDHGALYEGQPPRVVQQSAVQRARAAVPAGASVNQVSVSGAQVTVTVQMSQELLLAVPGGPQTATFTASATATAQRGVEGVS